MYEVSRQGAVDVISGDEPLNVEYVDAVRAIMERCMRAGQPRIVLNLRGVPLIDSAGLEMLLEVSERSAQRGGVVHLAAANGLCDDILRISGVGAQFEVYDDVMPAVGSFAI